MEKIEDIFKQKCLISNDINEHLPVLKKYAQDCDVVVEAGVRSVVSTWAFLAGKPKELISVDIVHPSSYINHDPSGCNIELVEQLANENDISFRFILGSTLEIEIPECDLFFIDTLHNYSQLKKELELHSHKAKKYIILHDTESFKDKGETNNEDGIGKALDEFLAEGNWVIKERLTNNNGLTILVPKNA
jgi:hypothetical protein